MKIPSKLPITAEQSRAVRFQLGLTQASVIEQSELPGHKLKNFETGRFVPDMAFLQGLRAFYESKGIDLNEDEINTVIQKPVAGIGIVTPTRSCRFVVDPAMPQEQVDSILGRMDGNDVRIAELMKRALESGFIAPYSEKTDADTKELYGLMAENYLLFRALQGRNILLPQAKKAKLETQADLISSLYAGLLLNDQQADAQTIEVLDKEEA